MISAVGSGVKRMISAVESAGKLKRTFDDVERDSDEQSSTGGDSGDSNPGGVADLKYSYGDEGNTGKPQKMDNGVHTPLADEEGDEKDEGTNAVHGMVTVMGRRRDLTTTAWAAVGEICSYDLFGIFDGPAAAKTSGEMLIRLVTEEIGPCGGGVGVDWDKVVKASLSGTARAVVIVGKDEVVVLSGRGGSKVVLCRRGAVVPLSRHDDDKSHAEERVMIHNRTEMDEFIIIACLGVWEVVSEEDTCQLVERCLNDEVQRKHLSGTSPAADAAALVAEVAIARGSKDNISVIVIDLKNSTY